MEPKIPDPLRIAVVLGHAVAACSCEQHPIVCVPIGGMSACPACGQNWRMVGLKITASELNEEGAASITTECHIVPMNMVTLAKTVKH